MGLNYSNSIKSARLQVVADAMANGKINIYTADYAILLVSVALPAVAADVLNGTLTIKNVPLLGTAIAAGTAAIAKIVKSDDGVVADGLSVSMTLGNFILDNINVATGQIISIMSGTIIHG